MIQDLGIVSRFNSPALLGAVSRFSFSKRLSSSRDSCKILLHFVFKNQAFWVVKEKDGMDERSHDPGSLASRFLTRHPQCGAAFLQAGTAHGPWAPAQPPGALSAATDGPWAQRGGLTHSTPKDQLCTPHPVRDPAPAGADLYRDPQP